MYKIEIKEKNKVVKRKYYQSKTSFERWRKDHTKNYKRFYTIHCYEFVHGAWVKI